MQYGRHLGCLGAKQSTELSTGSVDKETLALTRSHLLPCTRPGFPLRRLRLVLEDGGACR
jgi:hypothetical protein